MSTVYFLRIGDGGPIKVGFTRGNPSGRIAQLQLACPWKLQIIGFLAGSKHYERALHERLAAYRMMGEWFEPASDVVRLIDQVLSPCFRWEQLDLSDLDRAIMHAGSNFDLEKEIGIGAATISTARKNGMGPLLAARVRAYLYRQESAA